jgi:hypothetical protein
MTGTQNWAALLITAAVLSSAAVVGAQTPPCKLGDVPVPGLATKTLTVAQFQALHAAVAPAGDAERWAEIPWEADLAAARQRAAREHKPLVLWLMDGHPLGCT